MSALKEYHDILIGCGLILWPVLAMIWGYALGKSHGFEAGFDRVENELDRFLKHQREALRRKAAMSSDVHYRETLQPREGDRFE